MVIKDIDQNEKEVKSMDLNRRTEEPMYERKFEQQEAVQQPTQPKPLAEYQTQKKPQLMSRKEIKEFNENPKTKAHKVRLIGKKTFWVLLTIIALLSLAIVINIFWLNISIASGKMNGNTTLINNIDVKPSEVKVPVTINDKDTNNYQHDIIVKVDIPESEKDEFVGDIVDRVLEGINGTG